MLATSTSASAISAQRVGRAMRVTTILSDFGYGSPGRCGAAAQNSR